MVKRQGGTHTGTSSRDEMGTIQQDKWRELRDGQKPKQREGQRQHNLCPKQNPMRGFGGSARRQNFHYQPQTELEGKKSMRAPKYIWLHQGGWSASQCCYKKRAGLLAQRVIFIYRMLFVPGTELSINAYFQLSTSKAFASSYISSL